MDKAIEGLTGKMGKLTIVTPPSMIRPKDISFTIINFSASGTIIKLKNEQAINVTDSLTFEEVDVVHLNVGKASFKIGQ